MILKLKIKNFIGFSKKEIFSIYTTSDIEIIKNVALTLKKQLNNVKLLKTFTLFNNKINECRKIKKEKEKYIKERDFSLKIFFKE